MLEYKSIIPPVRSVEGENCVNGGWLRGCILPEVVSVCVVSRGRVRTYIDPYCSYSGAS